MAKVVVSYKVPDGEFCTVVTEREGLTPRYDHCQFRSSSYREKADEPLKCRCNLFGRSLTFDEREIPYKCPSCIFNTERNKDVSSFAI
jgi:hypothetical protein